MSKLIKAFRNWLIGKDTIIDVVCLAVKDLKEDWIKEAIKRAKKELMQ